MADASANTGARAEAGRASSRARHSKLTQGLGRAGMVCYGLVHVVIAYLAVRVAFGGSKQSADQKGAIAEIGSSSFGAILLWLLALGLIAFGLWQFLMAGTGYGWVSDKRKRAVRKVGSVARGVVVIVLGISAIQLVTEGNQGRSSNQKEQELTGKLLLLPAGPALVAVVAAIILGVAFSSARKGIKRIFLDDLDTAELPAGARRWVERLGMTGYVAKAVVFAIVGVLVAVAAFSSNAGKSGGLDAALRTLAAQPFGPYMLAVVALGLAAFGIYCFAAARAHKS